MRKLDLLVPVYNEDESVLRNLLDSVQIQQNVDLKKDLGVIICCDGGTTKISKKLKQRYTFPIEDYVCEHRGVSATRNACFEHSEAEYVMFCDADDMFLNVCGLWIVFREMEQNGGFDVLVSQFVEETMNPQTKEKIYVNHDMDSTFVHGKIFRRQYLADNNIRWNADLTIHEDSFFNILAQRLTNNAKYCSQAFYLWKWRDESVCRHDPKYILKTYNNMLESSTALIHEFIQRGKLEIAQFYATTMIYDAYYMMNKDEWLNQENSEYRYNTEVRFKQYYLEFKMLFDSVPKDARSQIIVGMKNRFFKEGMLLESITFEDWIEHVLSL